MCLMLFSFLFALSLYPQPDTCWLFFGFGAYLCARPPGRSGARMWAVPPRTCPERGSCPEACLRAGPLPAPPGHPLPERGPRTGTAAASCGPGGTRPAGDAGRVAAPPRAGPAPGTPLPGLLLPRRWDPGCGPRVCLSGYH